MLWLDFRMLMRESVCTSLVNNETDVVLFGLTFDGQVALFGTELYGYRVNRDKLTNESGLNYILTLSDRYEVEPVHLAIEWNKITWYEEDDDVMNMYLHHEGQGNPEVVVQTATRRITLALNSYEVFSENWTPPDGLVYLSTNNRSNPTRTALAIYNMIDKFCLIDQAFQLDKLADQYQGNAWGPPGVEDWSDSLCINSRTPVICGGVLDEDFRMIVTFSNRTVSVLDFRTNFHVVEHKGYFSHFFTCHDTNRTILLIIAIILIIEFGIIVLVLLTVIVTSIKDVVSQKKACALKMADKQQKPKSPVSATLPSRTRTSTSTVPVPHDRLTQIKHA